MTETNMATQTVQFIENDRPSLQAGMYTITVTQALSNAEIKTHTTFSSTRTFHVEGDQFSLNPQTVYSVFPGVSSKGSYSHVLPSIILKRSTLPWERSATQPPWEKKVSAGTSATSQNSEAPWLALLLFHEGEVTQPEVITVGELSPPPQASPTHTKEDPVSLLKIPTKLLKNLLPSIADLKLLSHVRKGTHEDGTEIELSVIIGNRVPKPGLNTVHLVSLEHFFSFNVESETPEKQEEGQETVGNENNEFTAVISLHSWEFVCEEKNSKAHFKSLLTNLDVGTLNLPEKHETVNSYLNKGYVPLKHHLRNFQTTVSWYHSPLLPGENKQLFSFPFPVRAADNLLLYDQEIGMFDTSYAAAWQLGRLLALQDKSLSVNLFNWKRQYLKQQITTGTLRNPPPDSNEREPSKGSTEISKNSIHLLFQPEKANSINDSVPQSILDWFQNFILLNSIPFNYLIPDPDLLPLESLRFFRVDPTWVDCAIDGAFGIGEVINQEEHYQQCKQKVLSSLKNSGIVTGFLLRSEVIEHYPSLEIKGEDCQKEDCQKKDCQKKDCQKKVLKILRLDRLSNNVLLCLFSGVLASLKINQKPEALHFGLKPDSQSNWLDTKLGVLNMLQLSQDMQAAVNGNKPFTALEFAVELIEGSCIVEFNEI